jgi:D-aspartate ligase
MIMPTPPATHSPDTRSEVPGALLIAGAHGSLAVARSLGRRGIPVWFLTHDHPIASLSRYVRRSFDWAGPEGEDALDRVLQLARSHRLDGWVLFAGGDAEVRFSAQHHAALSAVFRVMTPPWETTRFAYDKRLTHQCAAEAGVAFPWTYYPRDRHEVASLDCRFPVILKPTVHEQSNAFTLAKAWRADDRASLVMRYEQAAALIGEHAIMVQELIPGGGARQFSFAAVCRDGIPLASLVARRTRQYPIDFGYTSTFVESIERPEVEEAACRILRALAYSGLVEIEFKYDERDGRYKILDINARPWTWIALGARAGVDFPYLAWQLAQGQNPTPCRGRAGVAWMHLARDLAAASQEMVSGRLSFADYLQSFRKPLVFAAFANDDMLPGLLDLPLVAARVLTRRLPVLAREFWHPRAVKPRPSL